MNYTLLKKIEGLILRKINDCILVKYKSRKFTELRYK